MVSSDFGKSKMYRLCVLLFFLLLSGCESRTTLAPVEELKWHPRNQSAVHVVRRGDTLYSIAFRYDTDFRALAAFNRLRSPYTLRVGQVVRIGSAPNPQHTVYRRQHTARKPLYAAKRTTLKKTKSKITPKTRWAPSIENPNWVWPVNGRVATRFIPQQGKKGIDIAGRKGEKIRAASSGVVAYAGNGLSGYGNLIIVKHNNQFLTAYGNNLRNLVKEGQKVKAGQIIAEMGVIDRRFWGVHFEIRRAGRPVNPLNYLGRG
ncbi:peptidase [Legionella jamestowniensis]|uniref:Peptidase n=1 Tax=Legionella jamestowniensis TaxID=455 RepID=A0ABX2XVY1_9GAMM|nr:peptidoglycan DD-metalloendopeptidase family protein [Legionella jamestowniensis]OCH98790.1 peptidase [Legionella jamestowniensis]